MAIEKRMSGGRGLPLWRPSTAEDLCHGATPIGGAGPPLWEGLLDAGGSSAVEAAQRAVPDVSRWSDDHFISDILQRFAGWVLDLPASENHHHAFPNGLFRHSLEVASYAVQDIQERWSRGPDSSILTPVDQAHWLRVTFALGLLHDCGKLLDIEVRLSGSGPCWDPLEESLAAFKGRHGVDALAPTPHKFRPRRGLTGHERKGVCLLPLLLAGARWNALRPPLSRAFTALAFRHQVPPHRFAAPLAYVAEQVHRADVRSAQQDWRKIRRQSTQVAPVRTTVS
jgi:hypothetical protein